LLINQLGCCKRPKETKTDEDRAREMTITENSLTLRPMQVLRIVSKLMDIQVLQFDQWRHRCMHEAPPPPPWLAPSPRSRSGKGKATLGSRSSSSVSLMETRATAADAIAMSGIAFRISGAETSPTEQLLSPPSCNCANAHTAFSLFMLIYSQKNHQHYRYKIHTRNIETLTAKFSLQDKSHDFLWLYDLSPSFPQPSLLNLPPFSGFKVFHKKVANPAWKWPLINN